jgi:hypothetical protein
MLITSQGKMDKSLEAQNFGALLFYHGGTEAMEVFILDRTRIERITRIFADGLIFFTTKCTQITLRFTKELDNSLTNRIFI